MSIYRDFDCRHKQLTLLQGVPVTVDGSFYCANNQLASLHGAPTNVGRDFDCRHNQITSLQGAPVTVDGSFYCANNQLASLHGAPTSVGRDFDCRHNQITSLQGAPKNIGGAWIMTVYQNTPLLRLLLINGIDNFYFWGEEKRLLELEYVFKKYYPEGRQAILKCGLEMMSIGCGIHANNARMGPG